MNRLADEASPYLRQHADNPVHWWPWGEAAFAHAAAEDKPVLLSIGYATCHWCHVMAHESFEDPDVAAVLNDVFVCVKVDREERPDVDALYMAVCQMVTGQGGWPLTVLLTPDRRPFYVGTYFPPRSRHGRAGVVDLSEAIHRAWTTQRDRVEAAAADLTRLVQNRFAPVVEASSDVLGPHTFAAADAAFRASFDPGDGGFGAAPKFPRPHVLAYLLRRYRRTGERDLLAMVTKTLEKMQQGGLHDALGGGFHRYSTDAEWRLPHFEKMLYDQAGLLAVYAEAAALAGNASFANTAEGIADYVARDLRDAATGAYYCAEDADSARADGSMHEGAFYVWTVQEVEEALGEEEAAVFCRVYGFVPEGNFEDEATGRRTGENVLFLPAALEDLAPADADPCAFVARIAAMRARLFEARARRPRPLLDDKVLADWNGWFRACAAHAARWHAGTDRARRWQALALEGAEGAEALAGTPGEAAAPAPRLHHVRPRHKAPQENAGPATPHAVADDYAFQALAHLEAVALAPAYGIAHLVAARRLLDRLIEDHWDEALGLFTTARRDAPDLLAAPADRYDGAMPSANAVALLALQRLYHITSDARYGAVVERMWAAAAAEIVRRPDAYAAWLLALDERLTPPRQIVVRAAGVDTDPLVAAALTLAGPDDLVVVRTHENDALSEAGLPGFGVGARTRGAAEGEAFSETGAPRRSQAFVCQNFACSPPVDTPEALRALLGSSPHEASL